MFNPTGMFTQPGSGASVTHCSRGGNRTQLHRKVRCVLFVAVTEERKPQTVSIQRCGTCIQLTFVTAHVPVEPACRVRSLPALLTRGLRRGRAAAAASPGARPALRGGCGRTNGTTPSPPPVATSAPSVHVLLPRRDSGNTRSVHKTQGRKLLSATFILCCPLSISVSSANKY